MKFVNLTPHTVVISNPYLNMAFEPSGLVSRVEMEYETEFIEMALEGGIKLSIPCQVSPKARIINLPEPKEGVLYIVSSYVARVVRRNDLVAPLTDSTAERDDNGLVLSVRGLKSYSTDREIVFDFTKEPRINTEKLLTK